MDAAQYSVLRPEALVTIAIMIPESAESARNGIPLRLREMRPEDVDAALKRCPKLILPVGSCEQQGGHLPLGCQTIIAEHLADDLSARFKVLRAPAIEYGVNAPIDGDWPGTASVRRKTLHRQLNDLLGNWEAGGVREFILITAHRHDPHLDALATVVTAASKVRVVDIFSINVSDILEGQGEALHGDEAETSLLMHIRPDLVRLSLAQDYMMSQRELRRYRRGWLRLPSVSAGAVGRPSMASREKGARIYARIFDSIASRVFAEAADEEAV